MTNTPLKLKFGTDFSQAKNDLTVLATHTAGKLLTISVAAAETSKALRVGVGSASVDVAKQLAGMSVTAANTNKALQVLGEAGRWAFMVQHPALYLANQLLGNYKYALIAAGAAVTAFAAAAHVAHEAVSQLQEVAAGSHAAGVGSTFFQVWRQQAAELKTDVKMLDDALVHAKGAVRERVDGEGRAQVNPIQTFLEAMRKNQFVSFSTPGNFEFAKGAEEQIKAVIAAIKELIEKGHEVEALHLGELAFGGAGEKIVDGIRAGKLEMDALTAAAKGAGTIFDEELVKRADEMKANLDKAYAVIEDSMKPVLNDIGGLAVTVGEGFASWVTVLSKVASGLSEAYQYVKKISDLLPQITVPNFLKVVAPGAAGPLSFAQLTAGYFGSAGAKEPSAADKAWARNLNVAKAVGEANFGDLIADPNADIIANLEGNEKKNFRPKDLANAGRGSHAKSAGGGSETDQVETYISNLRKSIDVLQAEAGALGKSNAEKTKAVDLARAEAAARERGTPLTAAEREQVGQLADKQAALNKQMEDYNLKQQQANAQAHFFGNALESSLERAMQKGAKFNQILQSLLQSLASAIMKSALLGDGPLAGMFGSPGKNGGVGGLFGMLWSALPKFDEGGHVPGSSGMAVPVLAHAGEVILNQAQQARVAGAIGGGSNVMHMTLNLAGANGDAAVARIATQAVHAGISAYNQQLPGRISEIQLRGV